METITEQQPSNKSFSELLAAQSAPKKTKKAEPKAEPKAEAKAPAMEEKDGVKVEVVAEEGESQAVAEQNVSPETKLESETAQEDAKSEEKKTEAAAADPIEELKSQIQQIQTTMGAQIQQLTLALNHERAMRNQPVDSSYAADPNWDGANPPPAPGAYPQMSQNPHMDKMFEDAVRSQHKDYDDVVATFKAHATSTNPQMLQQVAALPAEQRFEQMYRMGVMVKMHSKYGTLDYQAIEARCIAEGKRLAKEEFEKVTKAQRDRALNGISNKPTDISQAKAKGDDTTTDEYRSPAEFADVLRKVNYGNA